MLCRATGTGSATLGAVASGDLEVTVGDQSIQVVTGNVGMDVEEFGDLPSSNRFDCFTDGYVDAATGRIAEGCREVAIC